MTQHERAENLGWSKASPGQPSRWRLRCTCGTVVSSTYGESQAHKALAKHRSTREKKEKAHATQ